MDSFKEQSSFSVRTLTDRLPVGIITCNFDADFTMEEINEGFFRLTGYHASELEEQFQKHLMELVYPADRRRVSECVSKQYLNNTPLFFQCRILCKSGFYKSVAFSGQFMHGDEENERLSGIMAELADDGGADKRSRGDTETVSLFLGKHDKRLRNSGIMLFEWNIATDCLLYSYNWDTKPGFDPAYNKSCPQVSLRRRIHPDDLLEYAGLMDELREGRAYASAEFRIYNSKKVYVWCHAHAVTMYDRDEKPVQVVGFIFDIDEKKQTMEDLKIRAERDSLTGLYNRNETEKLARAYLDRKLTGMCALFMIDTDNFKQINDTKGHMLGDIVLKELAQGMRKTMREHDVVGRIGGDEFAVLMKDASREDAAQKAEALSSML